MTLVVPFDGSALAEAALIRATELRPAFHETIMAVSVIPEADTNYASDRG